MQPSAIINYLSIKFVHGHQGPECREILGDGSHRLTSPTHSSHDSLDQTLYTRLSESMDHGGSLVPRLFLGSTRRAPDHSPGCFFEN